MRNLKQRLLVRRRQLAEQYQQATLQLAELERTAALLRRNIAAMAGGIQELDGLLEQQADGQPPTASLWRHP